MPYTRLLLDRAIDRFIAVVFMGFACFCSYAAGYSSLTVFTSVMTVILTVLHISAVRRYMRWKEHWVRCGRNEELAIRTYRWNH